MDAHEYASWFKLDLEMADLMSARSAQSRSGQLGASDLGRCKEQTRLIITQATPTDDPDKIAAIIGNYVDRGAKTARGLQNPHLRFDVRTYATLPNGAVIPCNGDEVDPLEPSYTDVKTKDADGLRAVRRLGPSTDHRWQTHVNYKGLTEYGADVIDEQGNVVEHLDPFPADGTVRLIYLDRSGKSGEPVVWQEPYDPAVLDEVAAWLDDVFYAVRHGEQAQKRDDKPFCRRYCQFYTLCRGAEDTLESERITADWLDRDLALWAFVQDQLDDLAALDGHLKGQFDGMNAHTDTHRVTSTFVNHRTSPYWRTKPERIRETS